MKRQASFSLVVLLLLLPAASGCNESVKQPAVAGSFYPADARILRTTVDAYLAAAEGDPGDGRLVALIAPHAGYQFSGHVAAHAYRHLGEREVETVILIGASHAAAFNGASVYAEGSLATPLGKVRVNRSVAKSLLNEQAQVKYSPEVFAREHSVEVQLPFLQQSLKSFTVVPVLLGNPAQATFSHLTEALTTLLRKNRKAIIIASTDLSHYHDHPTAVGMDRKITDAVSRMSIEDTERLLMSGEGEMCGSYPVILAMMIARNLGATNGILYRYANSGDVTGERDRVVGYAAMGLYQTPLSGKQKQEILRLARATIAEYVKHRRIPEFRTEDPLLRANGATFVTISRNRMLRGCIGNIRPDQPLYRSVVQNAVSACSRDARFQPMTPEELTDMDVEVTVLSPLEPLVDVRRLRIGTHGIFLANGSTSGILLPQVATDNGWDERTFLEQVSIKAGLPKDAWKNGDTKLYVYTAEVVK